MTDQALSVSATGAGMARVRATKVKTEAEAIERFRLVAVTLTGDGEDLATYAVDGQSHRLTPTAAQSIVQRVEEHAARIAKNVRAMRRAAEALEPFIAKPTPPKSPPRSRG